MKSTTVALAALCAALAAASPLDKRALVTTIQWATVTVTVTGSPPAETPMTSAVDAFDATPTSAWNTWLSVDSTGQGDVAGSSNSGGWFGGWGGNGWGGSGSGSGSGGGDSATTTWITLTQSQGSVPTSISTSTPGFPGSPPSSVSSSSGPSNVVTPPPSGSTSVSSAYQQGILDSHNIHRVNASVPNLTWSNNMASIAAQIAASCVYAHDTSTGGGGYGQNIGAGAPPSGIPAMITNEMYNNEINWYPAYGVEPDMSNFEKWGHYSQIVWKSTTSVGCATQYCPNGLANTGGGVSPYFTVCNYSPPGMLSLSC